MKTLLVLVPFLLHALSAPVQKTKTSKENNADDDMALHLAEYKRYVKQVLDVLEDDPAIRDRIRSASDEDIADERLSDEIARLAPYHIRSKLDEAKRQTIQRQRVILKRRVEKDEGARQRVDSHDEDLFGGDIPKFDASDIRQVMMTRLDELKKEDKERRDRFVKTEMEKEHQRRVALKKMNEKDRLEAEEKHKFLQEKKKEHPKMHHPGSEAQFKEVWEEEDGLDEKDFDPRTFFELHDTNDDGYLDTFELEALFVHEVNKVYNGDDDNMPEMEEELSRMREHVFQEVDKDQDALISFDEFKSSTELKSFSEDPGWDGLEEETLYSDDEMDEYERMVQEEMEAIDKESQEQIERDRLMDAEKAQQQHEVEEAKAPVVEENVAAAPQDGQNEHAEVKENQGEHVETKPEEKQEERGQEVEVKVEEKHEEAQGGEEKKVQEPGGPQVDENAQIDKEEPQKAEVSQEEVDKTAE